MGRPQCPVECSSWTICDLWLSALKDVYVEESVYRPNEESYFPWILLRGILALLETHLNLTCKLHSGHNRDETEDPLQWSGDSDGNAQNLLESSLLPHSAKICEPIQQQENPWNPLSIQKDKCGYWMLRVIPTWVRTRLNTTWSLHFCDSRDETAHPLR